MASPIENAMYRALLESIPPEFVIRDEFGTSHGRDGGWCFFDIERNAPIASYRIDILLTYNSGERLAIERDGHDFHDRTKQQAAYDRARDRELLALGVPTIRFTGSEIAHSPERCAADAYAAARVIAEAAHAPDLSWIRGVDYGRDNPDPGAERVEEHW